MNRIQLIRARVLKTAQKETATGTGTMRIPGMKIGTQMNPGGPNFEDICWLADRLEMAARFMKDATYVDEQDMLMATKLVRDIEEGR